MKVKVVLNEQHTLLDNQKELISNKFGDQWEILSVPAAGWNRKEIGEVAKELANATVVFASPIPLLLGTLAHEQGSGHSEGLQVFLLHNDKREKKELPTGKVISVVAKTGWELIPIQ